jgi:serine phosphatase RsbU (regulator of sigma subunit)
MNELHKNNLIIQAVTSSIPYVHELMLPIKSIPLDTKILDMLTLFDIYSELHALSVLDSDNNFIGIITRYHYINLMPRVFAQQLFTNSNLKDLLAITPDIFSVSLVVDVDDRIDQVVLEIFSLDMKIDILPVSNRKGILGIVKITDMTLKLFDVQNLLINTAIQTSARLKAEVELAAILQRNLLRHSKIDFLGLRGLATLITCSEISGDFYDYYSIDARWIVMLVGDVSGHGVASGTIVSIAKTKVNLLEIGKEKEPHKILECLNDTIFRTARQSLLMTMFVACLDTQTGELRYANAGHQFPYLYYSNTGQLELLEKAVGLPLGELEIITYEQHTIKMNVGDFLFIYTDAIVEEECPKGECFGYDRLEEVLSEHIKNDSEHLRDVLLERLSSHIERYDFSDDVTIFHVEFYQCGQFVIGDDWLHCGA